MGFVRIEQRPRGLLAKISILGIPQKFRRVLELSEHNWAKISETIGHLHQEVMWHRFYENESYMILPSKND